MRLDSATVAFVQDEIKSKKDRYNIQIVIGVALCIVAFIPVIVGETIFRDFGEKVGMAMMLSIIAVAVYLFVSAGVEMCAYEELVKQNRVRGDEKYLNEDYDFAEAESVQAAKWIGRIHAMMWPIVVGIYLYLGFIRNLWHPGWVVFAIAGMISPVIAVLVNILTERRK